MRAVDVLKRKRSGEELSREEIAFIVDGFTRGEIPDYQVSSFLMAVCLRGMTPAETAALTETMLRSGAILDFSDVPGPKIDKHSTGGVGDKTSLIIAPLAASAGLVVPMISGRGLGHTGGTLDKLEAIPGFEVHLDERRFHQVISEIGFAMAGQTEDIAPADRKLYALRDVTATVESIPLITASILSKKLAEGIEGLVLDVKVGSGAFMKSRQDAEALARSMISTAANLGTKAVALLTDMSQPLGTHVGNALEVSESLAVLRGEGPEDLESLCLELTARMLVLGRIASSREDGLRRAREELASGRGLSKFLALVRAQGGDEGIAGGGVLAKARARKEVAAARDGFVSAMDAEKLGTAAMLLGAGREKVVDPIDPGAGLILHKKIGDEVRTGEPLVTLHYNEGSRLAEAERRIREAYLFSERRTASPELVLATLES
jgi:pyrimidine-nucleoside phosphorylase